MKRILAVAAALSLLSVVPAMADTVINVDEKDEVTVTKTEPAVVTTTTAVAVKETPVVIVKEDNTKEFEGEILSVDYPDSQILVRDTSGRDRRVIVKQGMINNYKVGDYVKVELMADHKEAKMIRTLKDVSHFEGTVVTIVPTSNQLVVRDSGQDRTVIVAAGMTEFFKPGDRVRIYLLTHGDEVRYIRVLR